MVILQISKSNERFLYLEHNFQLGRNRALIKQYFWLIENLFFFFKIQLKITQMLSNGDIWHLIFFMSYWKFYITFFGTPSITGCPTKHVPLISQQIVIFLIVQDKNVGHFFKSPCNSVLKNVKKLFCTLEYDRNICESFFSSG